MELPVDEKIQGRCGRGEAVLQQNRKIVINGEEHEADNILICTGSSPAVPPIPGSIRTMWWIRPEF